jgi:hypothetical protein
VVGEHDDATGKKPSDCSVAPGRGGGVRAPWRGSAAPWARAALHAAAASSLGGTAASEECNFFNGGWSK